MLPRSQGRQIHTVTPHRAHVKTRASAAATAPAARGLYKARRARDPLSGYPVHRATAAGDQEVRDATRTSTPRTPPLLATTPAPRQSAPRHLRWVTSDEHTPGVSGERLSGRPQPAARPSEVWINPPTTRATKEALH